MTTRSGKAARSTARRSTVEGISGAPLVLASIEAGTTGRGLPKKRMLTLQVSVKKRSWVGAAPPNGPRFKLRADTGGRNHSAAHYLDSFPATATESATRCPSLSSSASHLPNDRTEG